MTDFEKELIYYIFHVQDAEDDNLSAEIICRKLYKHGLIDRGRGYWRPKKRPKYRWPVRAIKADRKTEPRKLPNEDCGFNGCDTFGCPSNYCRGVEDEPQTDCSWR